MGKRIGILLFDGAEEMDFVAPWEVMTAAVEDLPDEKVLTVAEKPEPVLCEKGMRVIPDTTYADVPELDVPIVPGGSGARRQIDNAATVEWLTRISSRCSWITSVCTGAFLLVGSGVAQGRRVTTHHDFIEALKELGGADVVERVRYVRDGNLVTAAGVMLGIEMSLWLVGQLYGAEIVRKTKSYIAYDFPPRSSSQQVDP